MTLHPKEMKNIVGNKVKRKTALVVDDTPDWLDTCKDFLEFRGYNVVTASSAKEAMSHKDETFNIAIIDGLNGNCFGVYDAITAQRKVIFTGEDDYIATAKQRGIEAHPKFEGLGAILKNEH